jgi:hypothetical protein
VSVAAVTFLPGRCLETIRGFTYRHTEWREGFTKYVVEMGSGAIIYIPSLIKIGSDIQKLIRGIQRHTDSMVISYAYFYYFRIRHVG